MKLLLDQNLSPRLASRLDDLFPGTLHVRDVGLEAADDNIVWQFAMDNVARKAHVGRENLYKTLSENGNPELRTINRLLHAMGLRLSVTAG